MVPQLVVVVAEVVHARLRQHRVLLDLTYRESGALVRDEDQIGLPFAQRLHHQRQLGVDGVGVFAWPWTPSSPRLRAGGGDDGEVAWRAAEGGGLSQNGYGVLWLLLLLFVCWFLVCVIVVARVVAVAVVCWC